MTLLMDEYIPKQKLQDPMIKNAVAQQLSHLSSYLSFPYLATAIL